MDGFQGKIGRSLQFRLSSWLALVIVCVAVAAGIFSFAAALHEANELQDDQLRQVAALLNDHRLSADPTVASRHATDSDPEFRVIVQALPPWAGFAGARRPGVSPDQAGFMQLVKTCGCRYNGDRVGVVIQPLPAWAGVAGARRTAVAPDPAILVQLEQLVSARHDRGSAGLAHGDLVDPPMVAATGHVRCVRRQH